MKNIKIANNDNELKTIYDRHGRVVNRVLNETIFESFKYFNFFGKKTIKRSFKFGDIENNYIYKYNRRGKISSIFKNEIKTADFVYNKHGKLLKENNYTLNITMNYCYDKDGYIISKEKLDHTNKTKSVYCYKYMSTKNGKKIFQADDINGTKVCCNNHGYGWNDLKQLTTIGNFIKYVYDNNNNILTKTSYLQLTNNIYKNNKLIEQCNDELIHFNYCGEDLIGFTYNGENYYFEKDHNNSILAIYDSSANLICEYVYYSKGNHLIYVTENNESICETSGYKFSNKSLLNFHIADLNPFRYKSRYFDIQTGLYLSNNIYYDAEIGMELSCNN